MWSSFRAASGAGNFSGCAWRIEGEFVFKVVPEDRQQFRLQSVQRQFFLVYVVVGSLDVPQGHILHVAPAVRLARQEGNPLGGLGRADKGREVGRQRRQGELIDEPVAFVVPSPGEASAEWKQGQQAHRAEGDFFHHAKFQFFESLALSPQGQKRKVGLVVWPQSLPAEVGRAVLCAPKGRFSSQVTSNMDYCSAGGGAPNFIRLKPPETLHAPDRNEEVGRERRYKPE